MLNENLERPFTVFNLFDYHDWSFDGYGGNYIVFDGCKLNIELKNSFESKQINLLRAIHNPLPKGLEIDEIRYLQSSQKANKLILMKRNNDIRYEVQLFMDTNKNTNTIVDTIICSIEEFVAQDYPHPLNTKELMNDPKLIKYRKNWGFNAW